VRRTVCKTTQRLVKGRCVAKKRVIRVLGVKKTKHIGVKRSRTNVNLPFTK